MEGLAPSVGTRRGARIGLAGLGLRYINLFISLAIMVEFLLVIAYYQCTEETRAFVFAITSAASRKGG